MLKLRSDIPITHIKSNRTTLVLTIKANGEVILKTPHYSTKHEINDFIDKNSLWIKKRVEEAKINQRTYSLKLGSKVPYLGIDRIITEGIQKKGIILDGENLFFPKNSDIKELLIKWYKEQARNQLTKLVDEYTEKLNTTYTKIYIKNQKTRWGSCSGKKNLNFNWKVVLTSPETIKYLAIHEVCHLIEMNHSRKFWDLVKKHDPLFMQHRKELQIDGHYLTSFFN